MAQSVRHFDVNVLFCSLPLWADLVMAPHDDFEDLAIQWFTIFTPTTEMKKLRSGFLLKEILERFMNETHSTLSSNPNLWMYFAHDITIANMLNSLGVFEVLKRLLSFQYILILIILM